MAYGDPAFLACLHGSVQQSDLVAQFKRLHSARLAPGRAADMRRFAEFVHDCIYTRLPDEAIDNLRARALAGA
ncbi:hypothetical protein [Pseudacidovorax intermedius]|uniref:Uncharacterized protein n=1 Tax=Pseudacidovorax intermedius TaxID=433924 RepID=A0A147GPP4_9BURK|nr:hypothetical protein [Pseudacidovorax intermedius]KTT15841.1 hypothetical protein NS331_19470 [Pseudacidovorax intermedius]